MKKYIKNKNFIPDIFISEKEFQERKKEKNLLTLLIIVNVILIPISFNNLYGTINSKENEDIVQVDNKSENLKVQNEIDNFINLYNNKIINMDINNWSGKIVLKDLSMLEVLEEKGISVKSISKDESGNYEVEVGNDVW